MKISTLIIIAAALILHGCSKESDSSAGPDGENLGDYFKSLSPLPTPPEGYKWTLDERFSDGFDGTELDKTKWRDYHPFWRGRPPAKFMPEAVSVKDGALQLKCGILNQPDGDFTMQGGAVTSKSELAGFGYYETKLKATQISMSSTFWLINNGSNDPYPRLRRELDIVETIGGAKRWPAFATQMKSNTHIQIFTEQGASEMRSVGGHTDLIGKSGDAFHIFGAWWVDENTIHFYYNGEFRFTIHPDTTLNPKPMQPPMMLNLVSETYDWEFPPTGLELQDDAKNTTYYDWVRAFVLERIN